MMTSSASAAVLFLLTTTIAVISAENMNNGPYRIANSNGYATSYQNHEYFEVYSQPIKTRYSEVYWRMQDPVPLPEEIQERFANGKIMAVTGYEVDQVRMVGNEKEVSVPITWAYNHHYGAYLSNSKKTKFVQKMAAPNDRIRQMNHNHPMYWTAQVIYDNDDDTSTEEIPLHTLFSEGNGGEFRLSYHGYPKGYAQLVESPDTFHCQPMQIDTWNRNASTSSKYTPGGPLPSSSRIPKSAGYSGLIECPCTDRLKIEWNMTYAIDYEDTDNDNDSPSICTRDIANATECFQAVAHALHVPFTQQVNQTVSSQQQPSSATIPYGCSVQQYSNGTVHAIWNTAETSAAIIEDEDDDALPLIAFSYTANVNTTVELDHNDIVTITLEGPSDKWFGVAFGTNTMCIHMQADECPGGGPYAIVVSGDDVVERKLGFHGPGTLLESTITVRSNTVNQNQQRIVVLERSIQGLTDQYFSFDDITTHPQSLPIIAARGCSLVFAQHCGHGPSELNFLPSSSDNNNKNKNKSTKVCPVGMTGTIGGNAFDSSSHRCAPSPISDLQTQHNPTCTVQTYRGGLSCCRDGMPLLDQNQDVPWPDTILEYRLKFRFYFQEYQPGSTTTTTTTSPPSHRNLVRLYWQTEAYAGEYDIEQCDTAVVPRNQCIQVITARWKVRDMMHDCSLRHDSSWCTGTNSSQTTKGIQLIYAGPHCHAPTCLSMELYNADTGQLLCRMEPVVGNGSEEHSYDEEGFLALPPCLWGENDELLPPPQLLTMDTTLLSIKRNNSTLPHTGEMASWQMRGILVPKEQQQQEQQTPIIHLDNEDSGESTATTTRTTVDRMRRGQIRRAGS